MIEEVRGGGELGGEGEELECGGEVVRRVELFWGGGFVGGEVGGVVGAGFGRVEIWSCHWASELEAWNAKSAGGEETRLPSACAPRRVAPLGKD